MKIETFIVARNGTFSAMNSNGEYIGGPFATEREAQELCDLDNKPKPAFIAPPKINIVCARCGSENVTRDALARWDIEGQRWEISCELDNSNCDDCCNEDCLEEIEIEETANG